MDPLSISASCIGIVSSVVALTTTISSWVNSVRGMDTTIAELDRELKELSGVAQSLRTCVDDPEVATAIRSVDLAATTSNSSVWSSIMAIVAECDLTLKRYRLLLQKIDSAGDSSKVKMIKKLLQDFQATTRASEASTLRSRLQTIFPALSALVTMVSLTVQATSNRENRGAHWTTQNAIDQLAEAQDQRFVRLQARFDILLDAVANQPMAIQPQQQERPQAQGPREAEQLERPHEDEEQHPQDQQQHGLPSVASWDADNDDQITVVEEQQAPARLDALKINMKQGLEQGRRILSSVASASQASVAGGSIITASYRPNQGQRAATSLLTLQPAIFEEELSETILDSVADQSIMGDPLPMTTHSSIETWIRPAPISGLDPDQSSEFAKSLIAQAYGFFEARKWKQCIRSFDTYFDKYAEFAYSDEDELGGDIDVAGSPSQLRYYLCMALQLDREWERCAVELGSLLLSIGDGVAPEWTAEVLWRLARACFCLGRTVEAEGYCHRVLRICKQDAQPKEWWKRHTYTTLVLIKDSDLNFVESELWCELLYATIGYQVPPQSLAVAEFWDTHLRLRQVWETGDVDRAVEIGMRFISQYLMHTVGPQVISEHSVGLSNFFRRHGSQGLAIRDRNYTLLHLLASDRPCSRWRKIAMLIREGADVDAKTLDTRSTPLHCSSASVTNLTVTILTLTKGVDLNPINHDGSTPIVLCINQDAAEKVEILVTMGADVWFVEKAGVSTKTGERVVTLSPGMHHVLELAAMQGRVAVVTKFLAADQPRPPTEIMMKSAVLACQAGHLDVLLQLIEDESDVESFHDQEGDTLVMIAMLLHGKELALELIQHDSQVGKWASSTNRIAEYSAAEFAIALGYYEIADLLNARGGMDRPAPTDEKEKGLLIRRAIRTNCLRLLNLMLERDTDPNTKVGRGLDLPLMIAVQYAQPSCVRALLARGADWSECDQDGCTAADIALEMLVAGPHPPIRARLLECHATLLLWIEMRPEMDRLRIRTERQTGRPSKPAPSKTTDSLLRKATLDLHMAHFLVDNFDPQRLRLRERSWQNQFPLLVAVINNDLVLAEKIVTLIPNYLQGLPGPKPANALAYGVRFGLHDSVALVLRAGADPNAVASSGSTALHNCAERADPAMIQQLLAAGAKIDVKNDEGCTPFNVLADHAEANLPSTPEAWKRTSQCLWLMGLPDESGGGVPLRERSVESAPLWANDVLGAVLKSRAQMSVAARTAGPGSRAASPALDVPGASAATHKPSRFSRLFGSKLK